MLDGMGLGTGSGFPPGKVAHGLANDGLVTATVLPNGALSMWWPYCQSFGES